MITSVIPAAIRAIVNRFPAVLPHLTREARIAFAIKADISNINATYHDEISEALASYFEGGSVTGPRNRFQRAMVEAFGEAFDTGWIEGGAEGVPDGDALEWLNTRVEQEMANITALFQQAKDLRESEDFDVLPWVNARADMYTQSAASVYNAGKMLADEKQMLTWHLGNTEKHCSTCLKLNGKKHRASWYIEHDYIPGKPGCALECKGFYCDCWLTNSKGEAVTI